MAAVCRTTDGFELAEADLALRGSGAQPAFAAALGQNESATALSWNAHMPATLAVGTGHVRGQLRLYDIRLAGDSAGSGSSAPAAAADAIGAEGSRAPLSVLARGHVVLALAPRGDGEEAQGVRAVRRRAELRVLRARDLRRRRERGAGRARRVSTMSGARCSGWNQKLTQRV